MAIRWRRFWADAGMLLVLAFAFGYALVHFQIMRNPGVDNVIGSAVGATIGVSLVRLRFDLVIRQGDVPKALRRIAWLCVAGVAFLLGGLLLAGHVH